MIRDCAFDVAVTGVAARFPGCADLREWWSALLSGTVLNSRLTREELLEIGVPHQLVDDPDYVPVRGYLADADRFDNVVFQVSPRDAEMMDPQHRLMLEVAWAALEDAATGFVDPVPVTGVFASGSGSGYLRAMLAAGPMDPATLDQALHGTEPDFIASLISYKLGLVGPAIAVQTACSSGLVGVHLAAQALLSGDCDQALVVAAGIDFPQAGHLHLPGGIQSASGRCRPFDETADGVVAGSGVAAVVLRRLADAMADGPPLHGVILGSAVNNDGSAKPGYYAPSIEGQVRVIQAAFETAGIDASSVGYLEAHGTGTRVGDPIEWSAACEALTALGAGERQIAVGALKANIGHVDAAAGIAGLIKALLVVGESVVPPVAGFTRANPLLDVDRPPLYVPAERQSWMGPLPRRAGVSSFGIGGTNAHVLVEEPPSREAAPAATGVPVLAALAAADPDALKRNADLLVERLTDLDASAADVAFTLATGRARLPERIVVVGESPAGLAAQIEAGKVIQGRCAPGGPAPVVLLFPGQGAQYPGMAVPFAAAIPKLGAIVGCCLGAFEDADLAARVEQALFDPSFPASDLEATELAQPALFVLELAVARSLAALGITPVGAVGHSLGEIAAAAFADVLELRDAARFVAARGRAMQACRPGNMLAVAYEERALRSLLADTGLPIEVAAVNGPGLCVVAGPADAIAVFRSRLGESGAWSKLMRTSHAFHSELMDAAVPALVNEIGNVRLGPPTIPLGSNATGALIEAGAAVDAALFVDQARRPVRFADALQAVVQQVPEPLAVEIGPGRALSVLAAAAGVDVVPLAPARPGTKGDDVLRALGDLWTRGQQLRIEDLTPPGSRRLHLPGYAFAGPRWLAPEIVVGLGADRSGRVDAAEQAPVRGNPGGVAATVVSTPGPEPEQVVAGLWRELLGHAELGPEADFFDLGGDSMLVTHLGRRLKEALGVQVPLRQMLSARTLERQCALVRELVDARAATPAAST
jgi:phthiocerol/phenolphthiocerol synthesis type-I polyketide synthase E